MVSAVVLPLSLLLAACLGDVPTEATLRVLAASSLTDAFADLATEFEAREPGVRVELAFAGSQVLRLQIEQGAPGDVFASADPAQMAALVTAGLASPSRVFAHNELVVVVPPDNPARIGTLADLVLAERLVIASPAVPAGIYTRQLLQRAEARFGDGFASRVLGRVVSEESNVRLVRAKVELGVADAAIVYRTDSLPSARMGIVDPPDSLSPRADYPIALLTGGRRPQLAARWLAFIESPTGGAILTSHGFGVP